jgi:hypothetical protein
MPEDVTDLLQRAEQSLQRGDARGTGILVDRVLKQDFTNARAWNLLHQMLAPGQDLAAFQRDFAAKHYPAQAQLLDAPALSIVPPVAPALVWGIASRPTLIPTADAPQLDPSKPIIAMTTAVAASPRYIPCPRCRYIKIPDANFCDQCGYEFVESNRQA